MKLKWASQLFPDNVLALWPFWMTIDHKESMNRSGVFQVPVLLPVSSRRYRDGCTHQKLVWTIGPNAIASEPNEIVIDIVDELWFWIRTVHNDFRSQDFYMNIGSVVNDRWHDKVRVSGTGPRKFEWGRITVNGAFIFYFQCLTDHPENPAFSRFCHVRQNGERSQNSEYSTHMQKLSTMAKPVSDISKVGGAGNRIIPSNDPSVPSRGKGATGLGSRGIYLKILLSNYFLWLYPGVR